jgi:hypothetical protein
VTGKVTCDQRLAKAYQLRLVVIDRLGGNRERRIEGESCAQVTDAAAVVVALASDADDVEIALPPAVERGPSPPVASPPSLPAPAAKPTAAPPAPRSLVWEVGVIGGVDFNALPNATPGGGLVGALGFGPNDVELRATGFLPRRATLPDLPRFGGDIGLVAGALRYCRALFGDGVLDLAPCGGVEVGGMAATPVGLTAPGLHVGPWFAQELGLMGLVRLSSRVVVSLELDGLIGIVRPQFTLTPDTVFQPPLGTARVLIGLRVRFP